MTTTSLDIEEIRLIVDLVIKSLDSDNGFEILQPRLLQQVEQTNQRLRKCDHLLRKGLRSEAIQEAETEPNLFDLVAELDFPEWNLWQEKLNDAGLPASPELLLEVAAELNEAYNLHRPLEQLLRKHRVHALARSPLSERIPILRTLVERDPSNDLWRSDLVAYEKARFTEIDRELSQAFSQEDFGRVARLSKEVSGGEWIAKPEVALVKRSKNYRESLVAANSTQELRKLVPKIDAAFSALDTPKAQSLRNQWNNYFDLAEPDEKSGLLDQVSPAFNWIDEEVAATENKNSQKQAAVDLEVALDDEQTTKAELQRLMHVTSRFDEPVSDRIQRRFDDRIRTFERGEKRRTFIVVSSVATLILAFAGLATLFFLWQAADAERQTAENEFEQLLNDVRLTDAKVYLENISESKPSITNSPRFKTLTTRFEDLRNKETDRLIAFDDFLQPARDLIEDSFTPTSQFQFHKALGGLIEADKITKDESEEVKIKQLEQKVKSKKTAFQQKTDGKFSTKVDVLREFLQKEGLDGMSANRLGELKKQAEELLHRRGDVSAEAFRSSQITIIDRRISDLLKSRESAKTLVEKMVVITKSVGNVEELKRSLESFRVADGSSQRSEDFGALIKGGSLDLLSRLPQYNALAQSWNENSVVTVKKADAQRRVAEIESLSGKFVSFLEQPAKLEELKEHYKDFVQRDPESIVKSMIGRLKKAELQLNYFVIERDGSADTVYYFRNKPNPSENAIEFTVCKSLKSLSSITKMKKAKTSLKDFGGKRYSDSPQKVFAEKANKLLGQSSIEFEEKIARILQELATDNTGIDAVLRTKLILQFASMGNAGSKLLDTVLEEFALDLDGGTVGARTANYLDPTDDSANRIRQRCDLALSELRDPLEIYQQEVKPVLDSRKPPVLPRIHWLGIVMKESGTYKLIRNSDVPDEVRGTVFVQDPNPSPSGTSAAKAKLTAVGKYENARLSILNASPLLEGMPLLLFEDQQGNPDE